MDHSARLVGGLLVSALLACPALYFLAKAFGAGPRSRRLANLALFCGLTTFVMPEVSLGWSPADWAGLFIGSGVVHLVLGLAGVTLALAALVARRDGGVGLARPLTGGAFCLLHLMAGASLILFGSWTRPATPWVYQAPDDAYRLTLPSPQWKQAPMKGATGGRSPSYDSSRACRPVS